MSLIDFRQEARDQGCLHIVLKPIGQEVNGTLVNNALKVLCNMAPVQLTELKSSVLFLRFLDGRDLPGWATGSSKWEQFSAHKTVHGLLAIGHCVETGEWAPTVQKYKEVRKAYLPNLCASKCLVYGPKDRLEPCQSESGRDGAVLVPCSVAPWEVGSEEVQPQVLESIATDLARTIFISLKTRMESFLKVLEDPGRAEGITSSMRLRAPVEPKDQLEEELDPKQSTRAHLARIGKHAGDLCLLIGQLQMASRLYQEAADQLKSQKEWLWAGSAYEGLSVTAMMTKEREKVLGQKATGVGAPSALSKLMVKYSNPRTTARSSPGGGAATGTFPRSGYTLDPRRLGDFSFTRGSRFSSLKRSPASGPAPTSSPSILDHLDLQGGIVISNRGGISSPGENEEEDEDEEEEQEENEEAGLEGEGLEGVEMEAMMEELKREEEEGVLSLIVDSRMLHKDFAETKFSVALVCYRKAGKVGTLALLESTLKLARYLVKQKHYVKAADTLQKTARIDGISDSEKLSLYQAMAAICHSMNYLRKEAMFTLYAARLASSIARSNQQPLLREAHELLLKSLPGYRLSLDVGALPSTAASHIGWPSLQAEVLKDFIILSSKLGEDLTVIRYACYLLQVFSRHMDTPSLKGVIGTLESVVRAAREKCARSSDYASTMAGKLLSPIPLTQFPIIRSFHTRALISIMQPRFQPGFSARHTLNNTLKATPTITGGSGGGAASTPFIYSPFAPGHKKEPKRKEVLWVEGDPAEIGLSIANPLPFELRVEKMTLLIEGADVETFPSSLSLPGGSEQSHFALVSIPHGPGIVEVQGYEAMVFGVRYECYKTVQDNPIIRVVPKLPLVKIKALLVEPKSEETQEAKEKEVGGTMRHSQSDVSVPLRTERSSVVSLEELELLDGESCEFDFSIYGLNNIPITSLKVIIKPYKGLVALQSSSGSDLSEAKVKMGIVQPLLGNIFTIAHEMVDWIELEEYCKFSWDEEALPPQLPLPPSRAASLRVSVCASIPHSFRLINDFSTGVVSSSIAAESRRMIEVPVSAGDLMVKDTRRSATPTPSSNSRQDVDKEATPPGRVHSSSSLMDSLNLERPFPARSGSETTSSGSPTLCHPSPPDVANKGTNFLTTKKSRNRGEGGRRDIGGWNYNDIDFGLDKRASIRSDPGERGEHSERGGGKSRFAYLKSLGRGSAHTSPTSSITTLTPPLLSTDPSPPIFIPGTEPADSAAKRAISWKAEPHTVKSGGLARNSSFQVRSSRGNASPSTHGGSGGQGNSVKRSGVSTPTVANPKGLKEAIQPVIRKIGVEGKFCFRYAGGVGEGYYREAISSVTVTIRPSLLFEQFDVTNSTTAQELFQVAFVVHNVSIYSMRVRCAVDQDLETHGCTSEVKEVLPGHTRKKFVLLLRRFSLEGMAGVAGKDKIQLAKQYSKSLAKILHFSWHVVGSSPPRRGIVSLEGLHLPVTMATIMCPLPVTVSVYLNADLCSPLKSIHSKTLQCGQLTRLSVKLQNNSSSIFPVSYLVLEPYWFSDELKKIVKGQTGKVLHSNTLVTRVPQLIPGAMFEHEVCLTFLYAGSYFLDTKCMFRPLETTACRHDTTNKQELLGVGKGSSDNTIELVDGPAHPIAKSPLRSTKLKPTDTYPLTSSSLPVSFSSPQPSPPRSTPPPARSSPPPIRPKSAKALARKFETDFATRKVSLASFSTGLAQGFSFTPEPPSPDRPEIELPRDQVDTGHTQDHAQDKTTTEEQEHIETPPPIPTSKRPSLHIAKPLDLNVGDNRCSSKASVLSSSSTGPQSPGISSGDKVAVTKKGQQKSKLIGSYEYLRLQEERNKETGPVQVVIGPHFSFQVS